MPLRLKDLQPDIRPARARACHLAEIPDFPGCSAFGKTEQTALKEIKIAQELWLKAANAEGRKIPRPSTENRYSGRILARTPKSLHKALMDRAKAEGVSLNQLVLYILSKNIDKKGS